MRGLCFASIGEETPPPATPAELRRARAEGLKATRLSEQAFEEFCKEHPDITLAEARKMWELFGR